ncbi:MULTISPECIES: hypothetical protein [unclassified Wolbachia]|uniref:hypothetical protein n=1 Tax=unclassified Wolbachia TaxID=2640676 RepID=UPI003133142F
MSSQCSFLVIRVAPMMSFQRVKLESSLYYAATYLKLSFLDPSSQATRMTP